MTLKPRLQSIRHVPYRKNALAAWEYMIDELKKRYPIWKKELSEYGGGIRVDGNEHIPISDNSGE